MLYGIVLRISIDHLFSSSTMITLPAKFSVDEIISTSSDKYREIFFSLKKENSVLSVFKEAVIKNKEEWLQEQSKYYLSYEEFPWLIRAFYDEKIHSSVNEPDRIFQSVANCALSALYLKKKNYEDAKQGYFHLYQAIVFWQNANLVKYDEILGYIESFEIVDLLDSGKNEQSFYKLLQLKYSDWEISPLEELFSYFADGDFYEWNSQKVQTARINVLLTDERQGLLAQLEVRKKNEGRGNVYRDPFENLFLQFNSSFQKSINNALRCSHLLTSGSIQNHDFKWKVVNLERSNTPEIINGNSMGAAFALCLCYLVNPQVLISKNLYSRWYKLRKVLPFWKTSTKNEKPEISNNWAITGGIDDKGNLQKVEGYTKKLGVAFEKWINVVVPKTDFSNLQEEWEDRLNSLEGADTLKAASSLILSPKITLRDQLKNQRRRFWITAVFTFTIFVLALFTFYFWNKERLLNYQKDDLIVQKNKLNEELQKAKENLESKNGDLSYKKDELEIAKVDLEKKNTELNKSRDIIAKRNESLSTLNKSLDFKNSELDVKNSQLALLNKDLDKKNSVLNTTNQALDKAKQKTQAYRQIADSYLWYLSGERAARENQGTLAKQSFANALALYDTYDFRFNFLKVLNENNSNNLIWKNKIELKTGYLEIGSLRRSLYSFAASHKLRTIAIGGYDEIKLVNLENGQSSYNIKNDGLVTGIAFSDKHNLLIATWANAKEAGKQQISVTKLNSINFDTIFINLNECFPVALAADNTQERIVLSCVLVEKDNLAKGKIFESKITALKLTEIKSQDNTLFEQITFDRENNLVTNERRVNKLDEIRFIYNSGIYKNGKEITNDTGYVLGFNEKNNLILNTGEVEIYDEKGESLEREDNQFYGITSGTVNSTGKILVASSMDNFVNILKLDDQSLLERWESDKDLALVSFITENTFISLSNDGELNYWQISTQPNIVNKNEISSLSFSLDDKYIALNDDSGDTEVYNLENSQKVYETDISTVDESSIERKSAIDKNGKTYQPSLTIRGAESQISWTEQVIFNGLIEDWIVLSDINSKNIRFKVKREGAVISSLISKDGKLFAVAEYLQNSKAFLRIWDIKTKTEIFKLKNENIEDGSISSIAISPDSEVIALGYTSSKIEIWSIKNKNLLWKGEHSDDPFQITQLAFSNNSYFASFATDFNIKVWKFDSKYYSNIIRNIALRSPITKMDFFPDEHILAWTSPIQKKLFVWDIVHTNRAQAINKGKAFLSFGFSNDNKTIAISDLDKKLYFWKTKEIKDSIRLNNQNYLDFVKKYQNESVNGISNENLKKILEIQDTRDINYDDLRSRENPNIPKDSLPVESQNDKPTKQAIANSSNILPSIFSNFGDYIYGTWHCSYSAGVPEKAELNTQFPYTHTAPAESCSMYHALDVGKINQGYSLNEEDWKNGMQVSPNEEFYALIYITNVAPNNLPDAKYIAQNVKVQVEIDKNIGTDHWIKVNFSGDNTNIVAEQVPIFTESDSFLEIVPNSGILYDYLGQMISKKSFTLGETPVYLGNIPPGFQTDLQIRFKVRVKRNLR